MQNAAKLKVAKISSFYSDKVARPYVLLDKEGKVQKEGRVDPPQINDALIEWAKRVPIKSGGVLVKPEWDGEGELPREPRTDFQIFFQERHEDVLAANPALLATGMADRRALLSAASVFWRETLTAEERAQYKARAAEEKAAAKAALEAAEAKDPKLKTFRAKMQAYKESVKNIVSAAKLSSGPLWRAQRRLNAKYKLLEQQAEEDEEENAREGEEEEAAGGSKAGRKAGAAKKQCAASAAKKAKGGRKGRGGKGGASSRLVASDVSETEEEDEEFEFAEDDLAAAAEAQAAAEAMQKLLLATAKKGGKAASKKPASGGKGKAASRRAAAMQEEEAEAVSSGEDAEPAQQAGRRSRSGATLLAQKAAAKGRKAMYADGFELPPSQGPTPAKAGRGAAAAKAGKAAAAAAQPLKSPGKRTRTSRAAAVATEEPAAGESPAKKQRRSARRS